MTKIIIYGCVWSGLGNIIFTKKIADIVGGNPKIYLYALFSGSIEPYMAEYIYKTMPNAKIVDIYAGGYKSIDIDSDIIINVTPRYAELRNILLFHNYNGKFFRIFIHSVDPAIRYKDCECQVIIRTPDIALDRHNLYTSITTNSLGLFFDNVPHKTLSVWDKYQTVFTTYGRKYEFVISYIEFIIKNFDITNATIVVQAPNPMIMTAVRDYVTDKQGPPIIIDKFTLEESIELFCYSHKVVGAGGQLSMNTCLGFGKIILIDSTSSECGALCLAHNLMNTFDPQLKYLPMALFYEIGLMQQPKNFDAMTFIRKKADVYDRFIEYIRKHLDIRINLPLFLSGKAGKRFSKYPFDVHGTIVRRSEVNIDTWLPKFETYVKKKFANNDVRTYGKSSRFYKGAGETFDFRILVAIIILIIIILLVVYSITICNTNNSVNCGKNNMLITSRR